MMTYLHFIYKTLFDVLYQQVINNVFICPYKLKDSSSIIISVYWINNTLIASKN